MEHQAAHKLGSGIKGFLFDMDGTRTPPSPIYFVILFLIAATY
jgi:hypothetical protein